MAKQTSDDLKYFQLKEKLNLQNIEFDRERHAMKMKELEFQRESDRLHHERELERGRIKSAEIRKTQMRKFDQGNPFHQ